MRQHEISLKSWTYNYPAAEASELPSFEWSRLPELRANSYVKKSLHREVIYVPAKNSGRGMYIKLFLTTRWWPRLQQLLLPSKAAKEYYLSRFLLWRHIPTALPLGYATLGGGVLPQGSLFVSSELPETTPLGVYLQEEQASDAREDAITQFGELLGKVNRLSIYIDDYHPDNVLVERRLSGDARYWLIDHESSRPIAACFHLYRLKNLTSALYSDYPSLLDESEKLLFIRSYLKALHRQNPSDQQVLDLQEQITAFSNRLHKKQHAKRTKRRFRARERIGKLVLYRRRDIDGAALIEAYNSIIEGHRIEKLPLTEGSLEVSYQRIEPGSLVKKLQTLLFCGPGRQQIRKAMRSSQPDGRELLGYVELRPFGPAVLFQQSSSKQQTISGRGRPEQITGELEPCPDSSQTEDNL